MKCNGQIPKPITWHVATAYNESGQECHIVLPEDGSNLFSDLVDSQAIIAHSIRSAPNRYGFLVRKSIEDASEPYTIIYPACNCIEHLIEWLRMHEMNSIIVLDYITGRFLPTNLDGVISFFSGDKLFNPEHNTWM